MNQITVVIPLRETDKATTTLKSLPKGIKTIQVKDKGKGANWARNEGFKQVDTEFVLFSDNDIKWRETGIQSLLDALQDDDDASYSYGAYTMAGQTLCNQEFNEFQLLDHNYISTMSLIRSKDFPGFDESLERFQDWDLWLTMLGEGHVGTYCGEVIFDTELKDGISKNGNMSLVEGINIIKAKHLL